jgi:ketosteroid isomerase-like protein
VGEVNHKNMKIRFLVGFIILVAFMNSCQTPSNKASHENLKAEIFAVEKEFCEMARSDGVEKAFVHFAADSAVILRRNQLVKGKEAIRRQYGSFPRKGVILEWTPDFADVSASGDLGYTYGKYTLTSTDSIGHTSLSEGTFHTVWKRQPDGKWRFVWD